MTHSSKSRPWGHHSGPESSPKSGHQPGAPTAEAGSKPRTGLGVSATRFPLLIALLALLIALLPWAALAQGQLAIRIDELDTSAFPQVTLRLGIVGEDGAPVAGLAAKDFTLLEDGKPVTPTAVEYGQGQAPLSLVVAIDTSGSMAGGGLEAARAAALALVNGLPGSTQVALVTFSTTSNVLTGYTPDRSKLESLLAATEAAGDTALHDAVFDAANLCAKLPPGRKLIVVLTDGEDTSSAVSLADAADRAVQARTRVYTVGFGDKVDAGPLKRLAKLSGGLFYAAPSPQELVNAFRNIAESYSYEYVIRYRSGLPLADAEHTLTVRATHRGLPGEASQTFIGLPAQTVVRFASPQAGATVRGPVGIQVQALGLARVQGLELAVDGQRHATATGSTLSYTWDASQAPQGEHVLSALARDSAGATSEGTLVVRVAAPVEAVFVAPREGQALSGRVILQADVQVGWDLRSVEFLIDGRSIKRLTAPPSGTNGIAPRP